MIKAPVIHYCPFQGGSSVVVLCCLFWVLSYVNIILVRFGLLSGHLLRKSCSVGRLFVVLVISRFGVEGRIWVLNASVPGHCILVTFI